MVWWETTSPVLGFGEGRIVGPGLRVVHFSPAQIPMRVFGDVKEVFLFGIRRRGVPTGH